MNPLESAIDADREYVAAIRHDLHAHPELGYAERRTCGVVRRELEILDIQHVDGLAGGTGVLAHLPASHDPDAAPTIALRADMDALPIAERTGKPYASQNRGVMHACGHDGHTSILIGAARALAASDRPNNVLLVFQPAEEGGAGGDRMVKDGVLNGSVLGKPVDRIFGLHGFPLLEVGKIATRTGPLLASADGFEITIRGKGSHAAMPHFGIDPIVVASHIVVALQTIAARNVSPLDSIVVTVGQVKAGTAHNIIPDEAMLIGTLRALTEPTRLVGQKRIAEIAINVSKAFGAEVAIEWMHGYPVTWNHPDATSDFRRTVKPSFGDNLVDDDVDPVMGGEDFSFYGRHVPACFYWLGLLPPGHESYPNLHSPEFDFNDAALPIGIKAMSALALGAFAPTPAAALR